MSERIEVYAEDEQDFVQKYINTPRPCIIWTKPDFDIKKMNEFFATKGIVLMNTMVKNQPVIILHEFPKEERE